MYNLTFLEEEQEYFNTVFLVPSLNKESIEKEYIKDLDKKGIAAIKLHYSELTKNTPVKEMKAFVNEELIPVLEECKTKYLIVADGAYFKILTKTKKAEVNLGYVLDCVFGNFKVIYIPNFRSIFYDPEKVRAKIKIAMDSYMAYINNQYDEPGKDIIKRSVYPDTLKSIQSILTALLDEEALTVDIETFSLKYTEARIGTITFSMDQHSGVAFAVDYKGVQGVRELLREFFINYKGVLIFHHITFDATILIYELFMDDITDTKGLLYGISVMLRSYHDTKLIAYLATNTCAGNRLSLKDLAQEFAGNYANEDIKDITTIPLPELLEYNLIDGLSTWYTYNKYYPLMVKEAQLEFYNTIVKPAIIDIIQMQLTGLPMDINRVAEVKVLLEKDRDDSLFIIKNHLMVAKLEKLLNKEWVIKRNDKLKVKRVSIEDANEIFNPNSSLQLQKLLYEVLAFPVIAETDTKQPSTDKKTLEALKVRTSFNTTVELLDALINYTTVNKILTSFIPAFEKSVPSKDGWHYLIGSFNLGGTVSFRLSSSNPNLQNLPSTGTKYAKLIKSCIKAPPGWIFGGIDFNGLEDRISALTTKDTNKLKVFTDGYDGHCLRTYYYFAEEITGIANTVASINTIKNAYPELRQKSKNITFALTYLGTVITLMRNLGLSQEQACKLYDRYHELYEESDAWVEKKLNQAAKDGYIVGALGLKLRTPLLKQVIRGNSKTPYQAQSEGRTAGNFLGQSWGVLNIRAGSEFLSQSRKDYPDSIKPCAQIHDAQYFLMKDDIDVIEYVNTNLVKAIQWQDNAAIQHDEVKLGGEFALFHPTWNDEISIPNNASKNDIINIVSKQ